MRNPFWLVLMFVACLPLRGSPAEPPAKSRSAASSPDTGLEFIDTSFENASPLWYEIDANATIQIHLNYDHERSSPNRATGHFQIHAKPGSRLTLEFGNLDNVWNGRKGSIANEMKIAFLSVGGVTGRVPTRALPGNRVLLDLRMSGGQSLRRPRRARLPVGPSRAIKLCLG